MAKAKISPMMDQYFQIKKDYADVILFFRLGDFYEMFGPDAETASRILGIALTGRAGGNGTKVPMCGVPFHAADNYIAKLISAGLKVAVCEQLEDPKTVKGIVKRDVIRIMTPGTVLESNILKEKDSNYLIALVKFPRGTPVDRAGPGAFTPHRMMLGAYAL